MSNESPSEEGELNTASIKQGLTPAEQKNLRTDLEAVERGDGSSESILRGGAHTEPRDYFHRDWEIGNERDEMEEAGLESQAEDFHAFVKSKGLTEEQVSYEVIYGFLKYGDTKMPFARDANPELEKQLTELEKEWEAGKKK